MTFSNFKLKKDWYLETDILGIKNKTLIFTKNQLFSPNESGEYHIVYGGWTENTPNVGGRMILDESQMMSANDNGEILFEKVNQTVDITIKIDEISEEDENSIRNWRIQLDVKTSRKKLKEIERVINEKVIPILQ